MKKIIISILALASVSAFATSTNMASLPEVCRFKCDSEVIYSKYVNGVVKEKKMYGPHNVIFYSKDPNIQPGEYLSSDSRIGKSVKKDLQVCGIYVNLLTQNGDYIERLIPDTIYTNRQLTNGAKYLGEEYRVDDRVNKTGIYSLADKKPIYISNETFEAIKSSGLDKLKDDGVCR